MTEDPFSLWTSPEGDPNEQDHLDARLRSYTLETELLADQFIRMNDTLARGQVNCHSSVAPVVTAILTGAWYISRYIRR